MTTIQELRQVTVDDIVVIDEDLQRDVNDDFKTCWQTCIKADGYRLSDVMFKK